MVAEFEPTSGTDDGAPLGTQEGTHLGDIYKIEAPRLARFLSGRLRNRTDVEDMVQDAFLRLARSDGVLRNPEAYLQRIVRNLLIDRSRRKAYRGVHMPIEAAPTIGVPAEQAYEIEAEDVRRRYRAAVASLPPRTRDVFLLHRVEDLSYREIAGRLGISIRTVEWHIAQALLKIDEMLERS